MFNVYFENEIGQERKIGSADIKQGAWKIINDFLDDHNYESYYSRSRETAQGTWVDVGSHTEFFYIREE